MPQIALVTGASRGLGFALAEALAGAGVQVVATARTQGALEELDDRIRAAGGGSVALAPLDLTNEAGLRGLCRALHDRWGRIDLLVHCAVHAPPLSPAGHIAEKDFDRSIAVTLTASQRLVAFVEPLLRAAPAGRAVFFEDDRAGLPFFGAWAAAKGGQIALARAWAAECARTGPDIRILQPRPMPTGTRARFYPGQRPADLSHPRDEAARLLPQILAP
ncbi:MAG: SDR family oxidoreductase [Rhodobacteraceae bacterium]|nr:SDR family oxidoreductase [Paracoccaceae bacterium]